MSSLSDYQVHITWEICGKHQCKIQECDFCSTSDIECCVMDKPIVDFLANPDLVISDDGIITFKSGKWNDRKIIIQRKPEINKKEIDAIVHLFHICVKK